MSSVYRAYVADQKKLLSKIRNLYIKGGIKRNILESVLIIRSAVKLSMLLLKLKWKLPF